MKNYTTLLFCSSLSLGLLGCGGDTVGSSSQSLSVVSSSLASSTAISSTSSASSLSSVANVSSILPVSSSQVPASSSSVSNTVVTTIEEGDRAFCEFSGVIESDHQGYEGPGYANGVNSAGVKLTWAITLERAGNYPIAIRYANGSAEPRPARLAAGEQTAALDFSSTTAWAEWQSEQASLFLTAGVNIITLEALEAAGLANIDSISITGAQTVAAGMCPKLPPITVWIAGDSTVANGRTPCPVGWGKTIGEYFNDKVTVQNYAVGGRSVRTWLYDVSDQMASNGECRIATNNDGSPVLQNRWVTTLSQMQAGDYLLIQFGINDGSRTCPRHVGGNAFKEEYLYMANEAIKRGAHPVFITPAPAVRCSGSTAVPSRGFITETFSAAQELNIPVLDLHKLGTDLYNQLAFCPVAGGGVSANTGGAVGNFFCDDHTHFDTPGAVQISELIANELRAQGVALADYIEDAR